MNDTNDTRSDDNSAVIIGVWMATCNWYYLLDDLLLGFNDSNTFQPN
jgi:hypothetical protein